MARRRSNYASNMGYARRYSSDELPEIDNTDIRVKRRRRKNRLSDELPELDELDISSQRVSVKLDGGKLPRIGKDMLRKFDPRYIHVSLTVKIIGCALAIIFMYFLLDASINAGSILEVYSSLSNKSQDSAVNFDRRVSFISRDDNGNLTLTIGWKDEFAYNTGMSETQDKDPDAPPHPPVDPSTYAGQIINALLDKGYKEEAIAAALGNFVGESGLDPRATQGHRHDGAERAELEQWGVGRNGRAIGFAQWDAGRAVNLLNAADAAGVKWYDFDLQLGFFLGELASNHCGVEEFNNASTDVEHATWHFVKYFERCGTTVDSPTNARYTTFEQRTIINGWNTRFSAATSFYNQYFTN